MRLVMDKFSTLMGPTCPGTVRSVTVGFEREYGESSRHGLVVFSDVETCGQARELFISSGSFIGSSRVTVAVCSAQGEPIKDPTDARAVPMAPAYVGSNSTIYWE